ncbi:serine hydrolase [Bacillus sp. SM2101]|uniref:serine hydrolase domain-containing protein n=1 Tax=Bacillus sp. SM2101 TaxID=2805366 RepID=UPI001BDE6C82|nr:serine hydrolase [Bacillus sp. SM2101]
MNRDQLNKELRKKKINAVYITHEGKNIYEYYKNKKQKEKLHKINSCTKSVISILMGIALDKGYLDSIHLPVYQFFPELFEAQEDKRKMDITIHHLLTMSDGLHFPEFGEWNCFAPMTYHDDIVKFVIDRPMVHYPGKHMNYNSGCSHVLSAIIQKVTKMKTEDFANEHLFKPLGIQQYHWYADKMKINKGADGLILKIEDMSKIGLLVLQNGTFNGKKIVSSQWIKEATTPHLCTYDYIGHYGMHWWVNKLDEEQEFSYDNTFYFALGFGGQYIIISPPINLVVTIASETYDDSFKPMKIIRNIVLDNKLGVNEI